jgi:S1-C subfamily serine protease
MVMDEQAGDVDGVVVVDVTMDGPAEAAGLLSGDIVTSFDGAPIDSPRTLSRLVGARDAGDRVRVEVLRGGASRTVTVELGELDEARLQAAAVPQQKLQPSTRMPQNSPYFRR